MKFTVLLLVIGTALAQPAPPPASDLARVEAEPNLEKRAHAALDNAEDALRLAREAYGNGEDAAATERPRKCNARSRWRTAPSSRPVRTQAVARSISNRRR